MLEISNLRAGYGSINVLWDVTLDFKSSNLTTILGSNGAGKTTLLRAIMGLIPVTSGDIKLNNRSILGTPTWEMAELGIVMIPEGRMIFRDMSVEENLLIGAFSKKSRPRAGTNLKRIYQLFPRLKERRGQMAGSLSGGEAQMVAIGRGLMAEPDIILMDEPSLGLAPVIVKEVASILTLLKQEGRTIILVEQNTHMAVSVADQVHLVQTGKVLLSEKAEGLDLDRLHDLYFARET